MGPRIQPSIERHTVIQYSRPGLLASAITLMVIVASVAKTSAQGFFRPMNVSQSGRLIEAPRRIQQQLREAEEAFGEESFSEAVVRLGDLLSADPAGGIDGEGAQDYFLNIDDSRESGVPVTESLRRTARDMIGRLPPSGLETYELRYGALAKKTLEEAMGSRDWEAVRAVRRKYFHTLAGYEASSLLAQRELFTGHALSASLLLDGVVESGRAVQHLGSGVLVMHASASQLAGRPIPDLSRLDSQEVSLAGERQTPIDAGDARRWIDERFARLDDFRPARSPDFPMLGSGPHRNGAASGQMPLMNLRWMLDTTASPRQERTVKQIAADMTTGGKLPPPSWLPVRVGDQLLMRTTERLVGVDYRTGKRVWIYPWESVFEYFDDDEPPLDGPKGESGYNETLTQRVWNDIPYGQITTDGQRVFVLDDLRDVELATLPMMMRGTRPADRGSNTLVALDLTTEGKLLWRLGAGSDEASPLSDAFFLGPPLPLDGRLYVMLELAGDINLCCLDPATGGEIWRQQLVAVESGGIDTDPIRRVAGAMPTYHEGVMICPTGAGAMVAVDLGDRTLRWGVNYDRSTEMTRNVTGRGRGLELSQLMHRWFSGVAIASGDAVLVTPVETDRLYGFDLITGESLFAEKPRDYMRYLAGIRDNKFFVVGGSQVRAFDIRSGREVWETPRDLLSAGQQVSGLGVFGTDSYFLPTTANQIVQISLADGSVSGRRTTHYPLGSLVAVDGEIIVQGATSLAVAFGEATLEPLVNQMLQKDPDNFDAIVRKSELLIQHGERRQAMEFLARARNMQPDNDEVRMLSVAAMLGELRNQEVETDPELVRTLDELIDRPSQRVELLSLRIRSAIAARRFIEAADHLLALSSLIITEPNLESAADQVVGDPSRQCSLDAWLAARVKEVLDAADADEIEIVNQRVSAHCAAKVQGSTNRLKRINRHFGLSDGTELLRQELADRLRSENDDLGLERLALGHNIPSDEGLKTLSRERLVLLADAYARGGLHEDSARVLAEIADRAGVEQPGEKPEQTAASVDWPDQLSLEWIPRNTRIRGISLRQRVAKSHVTAGKAFEGWRIVSEGPNPLSLRDANGLIRRIPIEGGRFDDSEKEAQTCGGVTVVVMPDGLLGLDMYHVLRSDGEAVLWRRSLGGDGGPVASRRSVPTPFDDQVVRYAIDSRDVSDPPVFKLGPIMGDRVLLLQGGDLLAIDLFTRDTIWRNSTAPKNGSVLCDGRRVAVVTVGSDPRVEYFDLLDGRRLGSAPWNHGKTWAASGSHVLSYQGLENGQYEVKLIDAFTADVLHRYETDSASAGNAAAGVPRTFGRVVNGRYLVLLHTSGETVVWDIDRGREIGRPDLPAYPDLQGLHVMQLDGQLIVMPKRLSVGSGGTRPPHRTRDGTSHRAVDSIHAVSLEDGALRWSHELEDAWGCTLTQPSETPILVLSRSQSIYSATSQRKTIDVLAIDVDSGETLQETEDKEVLSGNNELETRLMVQPGRLKVIVQMGGEMLTYHFGSPEVPEPDPDVDVR